MKKQRIEFIKKRKIYVLILKKYYFILNQY